MENASEVGPSTPPSVWAIYHERPVAVQFREPYVAVTNQDFLLNKEGQPVATPLRKGILQVTQDGAGVLLVLQTKDPDPRRDGAWVFVGFRPDQVAFISYCEERALVQA